MNSYAGSLIYNRQETHNCDSH